MAKEIIILAIAVILVVCLFVFIKPDNCPDENDLGQ